MVALRFLNRRMGVMHGCFYIIALCARISHQRRLCSCTHVSIEYCTVVFLFLYNPVAAEQCIFNLPPKVAHCTLWDAECVCLDKSSPHPRALWIEQLMLQVCMYEIFESKYYTKTVKLFFACLGCKLWLKPLLSILSYVLLKCICKTENLLILHYSIKMLQYYKIIMYTAMCTFSIFQSFQYILFP